MNVGKTNKIFQEYSFEKNPGSQCMQFDSAHYYDCRETEEIV